MKKLFLLIGILCLGSLAAEAASVLLVPTNSIWRFLDNGSNAGTAWRGPTFNDAGWKSGPAELGYGDGDERTIVSYGGSSSAKYISTYFRHAFSVTNAAAFTNLSLRLIRDDGAVVYLNGTEVFRSNMPTGTINYLTVASTAASDDGNTYQTANLPTFLLAEGPNVLAVEMHQNAGSSSDLSFDLELTGAKLDQSIVLNAPAHGATGALLSPTLEVSVADSTGDNLSVTFFGRPAGPLPGPDFTVVALPDTQYYVSSKNGGLPAMFYAQTDWILANREARRIAFVTQLGDCVENGDAVLNEWLVATNALYRLENSFLPLWPDGVPYGIAVGNHDQSPLGNADAATTRYNQFFGEAHFSGRDYYGGHFGTNNDNHYELFRASGLDFIAVHLEFNTNGTAGAVLQWANNLLQTHSNRRAIVVSHWVLNLNATFTSQGQAIYNALRTNSNFFMMLGGHVTDEARREDTFNGNKVYTLLSDYQGRAGGGNGVLRMMEFSPSNNVIRVKTYSPYVNVWETDANSQFDLGYNMQAGGPAYAVIGTQAGVASGSVASVPWPGLAPNTDYEWYVVVSDGVNSTTSSVWRFTTGDGAPVAPAVTIAAPAHNSYFSAPADIVIEATASDADGAVTLVEFFAGTGKIGEDTSPPFTFNWGAVGEGTYGLKAIAHDSSGLSATSSVVTVNVVDGPLPNTPPATAIVAPANNSTHTSPANIVITATASDADGTVSRVEFYQGGTKIGESFSSPYSLTWGQVSAGNYTLTAVATDNAAARGTSAPVTISVLTPNETATMTRGPYLQMGTPASMTVQWRTDVATETRVRYGTNVSSLNLLFADTASVTDHVARITGLQPDTKYYYEMGTALGWFAPDANDFFVTSPQSGTSRPFRIWMLGDSGTADNNARNVRDAYLNYTGVRGTDLLLMLGDNAYNNGTDPEYGAAVFNTYPTVLQNTVVWPTIGNHDTAGSANPPASLPYFKIFTLPQNAEAGGVASGTEKYYSFDYANVHFICLDSMSSSRVAGSPMLTWLDADLNSTTQEWVIAFFHHPPYSKGSHNSDTETQLVEMRTQVLPVLEAGGVDMVFAGHSHSYERSFLLNGHYGLSSTLSQDMKKDAGSGREDSADGAYQKPAGLSSFQGAVYTVAGASGKLEGGTLNHPAMFLSSNVLGSVVLDVSSNRMDVLYLTTNGMALDYFTLLKSVPPSPVPVAPDNLIVTALSSSEIELRWRDQSGNELGFALERSTDGINFNPLTTVGANVTNGVDVGLTAATTYHYRVRAFNDAGPSAWSAVASATTSGPMLPPAPTGLTASAGDQLVVLNWDATPNTSSYNLWRATVSGGPYDLVAYGIAQAGHSDQGLVNGTTYYYVVSALGEAGEGPRSAETNATPNLPLPAIPSGLLAVSGDGLVTLTWDPATGAASYEVRRAEVSGGAYDPVASVTTTNHVDATVVNGTAYYYVVASRNAAGDSSNSVEVVGSPVATPAVPDNFAGFPGDNLVLLTWDVAANATSYRLRRSIEGGPFEALAVVTTTSYTDTSVTNGIAYSYVLSALNGSVESASTYDVSVIPVPPPPVAPLGMTATAGDEQITLRWTPVPGATSYHVQRAEISGGPYASVATGLTATNHADTGLINGVTYFYVVSAANLGGESAPSAEVSATPVAPPAAPSGLVAMAVSTSRIELTWVDNSETENVFEVEQSEDGVSFAALVTVESNRVAVPVTGLATARTYHYRVRAVNGSGSSAYSAVASAMTFDIAPPAPTGFTATTSTSSTINLSWTDTATNESGFTIEQSLDAVNFTSLATMAANSSTHAAQSLAPNTTYHFRIRAFNAWGDSPNAAAFATTLPLPPAAPSGLSAIATNAKVTLTWDASPAAANYRVKRSTSVGGPYTVLATVTALDYDDTSVANGTTYYYVVAGVNSGGESSDSAAVAATPVAPPLTPSNLQVAYVSTSQLSLTWSDNSANEAGFTVERKTGASGTWAEIAVVGPDMVSYSDAGLAANTTYFYRVRAFNNGGDSSYSAEASNTTMRPWTVMTSDNFESNFGSYSDGGEDCSRSTSTSNAHQGKGSLNIQDNTGAASAFAHTVGRNVSSYGQLRVSFWFKAVSMETGEDFLLEYSSNGGSTWQTVRSWTAGTHFVNGTFQNATVFIDPGAFAFSSNVKLRFRCDASDNNDDVYIDDLEFAGQ